MTVRSPGQGMGDLRILELLLICAGHPQYEASVNSDTFARIRTHATQTGSDKYVSFLRILVRVDNNVWASTGGRDLV